MYRLRWRQIKWLSRVFTSIFGDVSMTIRAETLLKGEGWRCPFTQERAAVIHQPGCCPFSTADPSCLLLTIPPSCSLTSLPIPHSSINISIFFIFFFHYYSAPFQPRCDKASTPEVFCLFVPIKPAICNGNLIKKTKKKNKDVLNCVTKHRYRIVWVPCSSHNKENHIVSHSNPRRQQQEAPCWSTGNREYVKVWYDGKIMFLLWIWLKKNKQKKNIWHSINQSHKYIFLS